MISQKRRDLVHQCIFCNISDFFHLLILFCFVFGVCDFEIINYLITIWILKAEKNGQLTEVGSIRFHF